MTKQYLKGYIAANNMEAAIAGDMGRKGLYGGSDIIMSNRSQE